MPETPTVRPGQVYESCDPRGGPRIRVIKVTAGRARVVDAVTGKQPRWIWLTALHASGTTKDGKPRRTGYRLIDGAATAAPGASGALRCRPERSAMQQALDAVDRLLMTEAGLDALTDDDLETLDAWANNTQLDIMHFRHRREGARRRAANEETPNA